MGSPTNLEELKLFLTKNRRVLWVPPCGRPQERAFMFADAAGNLWWRTAEGRSAFTALGCEAARAAVTFHPTGFSVQAFGKATVFTYLSPAATKE